MMLATARPREHFDKPRRSRGNSQVLGFIPYLHEHSMIHEHHAPDQNQQRRESTQIPMANILQELKNPDEQVQSKEDKKELHRAMMSAMNDKSTILTSKTKHSRKKNVDVDSLRYSLDEQVRENERQRLQLLLTRNKALFNELMAKKQTRKQTRNLTDYPLRRRKQMIQNHVDFERNKTFAEYSRARVDAHSPAKAKSTTLPERTKESPPGVKKQKNVNNPGLKTPALPKPRDYLLIPPRSSLPSRKDVKPARERQTETRHERTYATQTPKPLPVVNKGGNSKTSQGADKPYLRNRTTIKPARKKSNFDDNSKIEMPEVEDKKKHISSTAIVHEFVKHALGVAQERQKPPRSSLSGRAQSNLGSRPGTRHGQTPLPWAQDMQETLLKPDIPGGKVKNIPGLTDRPFKQTSEDTLWMISPTPEYVLKSLIGIWLRPFISDQTSDNYVENLEKHEKYAETQRSKLLWIRAYMHRLAAMV